MHLPAFKSLKPELSRSNLGDGEVIEFQIVLIGQVVRVHPEISSVVQNLDRALGLGQIPGRIRRLISALSGLLLANVALCREPHRQLLRDGTRRPFEVPLGLDLRALANVTGRPSA